MDHGMRRPRTGGFSVLELTIAIAILGVMMGVAGFALVKYLQNSKVSATKTSMQIIDDALTSHLAMTGSFPQTLQGLVPNYLDAPPYDGWDREFFYSPKGPTADTFLLISWGPDGIDGTADDIDYKDVKNERANRANQNR